MWLHQTKFASVQKRFGHYCKHTASHLHVDVDVSSGHHCSWTSHRCDMSTKYLHCVTSAMYLELAKMCKPFWTVSMRVRFCTSVNTNTMLQLNVCVKDSNKVFCCCVHDLYVTASCWIGWSIFCYTLNTYTVCGLSPMWTLIWLFRYHQTRLVIIIIIIIRV